MEYPITPLGPSSTSYAEIDVPTADSGSGFSFTDNEMSSIVGGSLISIKRTLTAFSLHNPFWSDTRTVKLYIGSTS